MISTASSDGDNGNRSCRNICVIDGVDYHVVPEGKSLSLRAPSLASMNLVNSIRRGHLGSRTWLIWRGDHLMLVMALISMVQYSALCFSRLYTNRFGAGDCLYILVPFDPCADSLVAMLCTV